MLHNRIRRGDSRRFRIKIFGGQANRRRKDYNFANGNTDSYFVNATYRKFGYIKITLIILAFIVLIFCGRQAAVLADTQSDASDSIEETIDKILEGIDYSQLENLFTESGIAENQSFIHYLKQIILCTEDLSADTILDKIKSSILGEIRELAPTFACILAVVLFLALINTLRPQTFNQSLINVCTFVGNGIIIGIVISKYIGYLNSSKQTILLMSRYIEFSFPIMITLMTASGAKASAAAFKPISALLCNGVSAICVSILIPIVLLLLIFSAINTFSDTVKLNKMCDFLKSAFKWIIGVMGVIFCFFITAKGIGVSVYDTVSIKALKYTMGNVLPLVNSMLNGGFDLVVASCVLIKNGFGILTMIAIICVVAVPLVQTICFSLMLKLVSAVGESIADAKTTRFISGASESVSYLCSVQVVVTIACLVTVMLATCTLGVGI